MGLPMPWEPQSQPVPFILQWMSLASSAAAHSLCPLSESFQSLVHSQQITGPFLSHLSLVSFTLSLTTKELVSFSGVCFMLGKMSFTSWGPYE